MPWLEGSEGCLGLKGGTGALAFVLASIDGSDIAEDMPAAVAVVETFDDVESVPQQALLVVVDVAAKYIWHRMRACKWA